MLEQCWESTVDLFCKKRKKGDFSSLPLSLQLILLTVLQITVPMGLSLELSSCIIN